MSTAAAKCVVASSTASGCSRLARLATQHLEFVDIAEPGNRLQLSAELTKFPKLTLHTLQAFSGVNIHASRGAKSGES